MPDTETTPTKPAAKKVKKSKEPAPGTGLDSHDKKRRDELIERFNAAESALDEAISVMNDAIEEGRLAVSQALEAYNEVIAEANAWQDDITTSIREYIEDKPEKWQLSAKGQAYAAWLEEFQDFEEVQIDIPSTIDYELENMEEVLMGINETPNID